MRPTPLATTLLLALTVVPAPALRSQPQTPSMFVVRGRVSDPGGAPVADAQVRARGSVTAQARTDGAGRFVLVIPLGSAASLRRVPLAFELRVEGKAGRLPLAGSGSTFQLDVRGEGERVRVRSNVAAAADAVIGALLAGPSNATVELAFGGPARSGAATFVVRELRVLGNGSAEAIPVAPPSIPVVATPAPAPSVTPARTPAVRNPARARTDSTARAGRTTTKPAEPAAPATTKPVPRRLQSPLSREPIPAGARIETSTVVRGTPTSGVPAGTGREPRVIPAERPEGAKPPPADSAARVRRIEPFTPPPAEPAPPETCTCRVRGTVEILWTGRPLEERVPVTVSLSGYSSPASRVDLFMGPPREFEFGPLPCRDVRLEAHAHGRLRYALATGDSLMLIRCAGGGLRQLRVVLVPVRR